MSNDYELKACEHIKAFVAYCMEHRIEVAACGCCSSPWVTCKECNIQIDEMDINDGLDQRSRGGLPLDLPESEGE